MLFSTPFACIGYQTTTSVGDLVPEQHLLTQRRLEVKLNAYNPVKTLDITHNSSVAGKNIVKSSNSKIRYIV